MIWAVCTTYVFFSFFWGGEITVQSEKSFSGSHHLAWDDVSIHDHWEFTSHVRAALLQSDYHVTNLQVIASALELQQQLPGQELRIQNPQFWTLE